MTRKLTKGQKNHKTCKIQKKKKYKRICKIQKKYKRICKIQKNYKIIQKSKKITKLRKIQKQSM